MRAKLAEAIVTGDTASYASTCTEDVKLLHSGAPLIQGRTQLEAHNAEIGGCVLLAVRPLELGLEVVDRLPQGLPDMLYVVGQIFPGLLAGVANLA